jgi:hypothetical protein
LVITRQGGKVVTIPLAPRTARAIDLAIGERCEGPIFLASDGRRLNRHGAGRIVRRLARWAGITKPAGPHTLPHAFITAALDAGVPLRDVQEAASHADPRTTMRYDRNEPPFCSPAAALDSSGVGTPIGVLCAAAHPLPAPVGLPPFAPLAVRDSWLVRRACPADAGSNLCPFCGGFRR